MFILRKIDLFDLDLNRDSNDMQREISIFSG